jgi:hypothetical protein
MRKLAYNLVTKEISIDSSLQQSVTIPFKRYFYNTKEINYSIWFDLIDDSSTADLYYDVLDEYQ